MLGNNINNEIKQQNYEHFKESDNGILRGIDISGINGTAILSHYEGSKWQAQRGGSV
jgi:hypothetical protein